MSGPWSSVVHLFQASLPYCWYPGRQEKKGNQDLARVLPEAAVGPRNAPKQDWPRAQGEGRDECSQGGENWD